MSTKGMKLNLSAGEIQRRKDRITEYNHSCKGKKMNLSDKEIQRRRDWLADLNRSRKGKPAVLSDKGRERISQTTIARNKARKGKPLSEKAQRARVEIGIKARGKKHSNNMTKEGSAGISASNKRRTYSVEFRERSREQIIQANKSGWRRTKTEKVVEEMLLSLGVEFIEQKVFKGIGIADFFLPRQSYVIEADGDYWHSLPGVKEKDERRDAAMQREGIRVLRLPEKELKESRDSVLSKIYLFLGAI